MGKRCWLGLCALLLLLPGAAWAEVLNYDYVYLSRNGMEPDGGSRSEGNTAGGFKEFGGHTHVFASIDDGGLYGGANPKWDYDLTTLRVGVGGHYLLGERTMIAPAVALLRVDGEVLAPAWMAPRELSGTGHVIQLDVRHAVFDWLELTAAARHTKLLGESSTEFVGGVLFHLNDAFAVGALYHDRDAAASTELTVRWYY